MKDKHRTKFVTKDIFKCSVIGAFTKLNPKYMMHNPVTVSYTHPEPTRH